MQQLRYIDPVVRNYLSPWLDFTTDGLPRFTGTVGAAEPHMARQHFLFHAPFDVLCFCHLYPHLLDRPGTNVFTAIGLSSAPGQLRELKRQFPNARTVGVFDDDLCGRVLDCKVALWQTGRDATFTLAGDEVIFTYGTATFSIPLPRFSLHRFRTLTGMRSTYRTVKPKGFVSFSAMLGGRWQHQ